MQKIVRKLKEINKKISDLHDKHSSLVRKAMGEGRSLTKEELRISSSLDSQASCLFKEKYYYTHILERVRAVVIKEIRHWRKHKKTYLNGSQ